MATRKTSGDWHLAPDGRYLASASIDESVRIWDVVSGQCLHNLKGGVANFWSIVFSPDGALLAGAGRSGIHLWDLHGDISTPLGSRLLYSDLDSVVNIRSVNFSPDGKWLVSGGVDRAVQGWDVASGAQLWSLHGHESDITEAIFLPGQDVIASSSYDGTIRLWDWNDGRCLKTMRIAGPYAGMKITGATGMTDGQRVSLLALGAVE